MREKITKFKPTRLVAVIATAMLLAGSFVGSARAMTLTLDAGGIPGVIPAVGFSLGGETGLSAGDAITIFDGTTGGAGLQLDSPASVVFTFLGSEAGDTNTFEVNGSTIFDQSDAVGATTSIDLLGGLLPFLFTTSGAGGTAANGSPFGGSLSIAFAALGDGSFIALFGDGSGDSDRDDFAVKIAVSAVPLPPAVWLFISAILGLVSFARIRRTQNAA